MENWGRNSARRRLIARPCWPRDVEVRHPEADPVVLGARVGREVRSGLAQAVPGGQVAQEGPAHGEDPGAQVAPEDRASGPVSARPAA